jgi:hypothetical protein
VIRRRSAPAPSPVTTSAAASTSRVVARLSANTVLSPVAAPSIATAATPAGMLPARNSSRGASSSTPWRL